jgi:hypothetical protein
VQRVDDRDGPTATSLRLLGDQSTPSGVGLPKHVLQATTEVDITDLKTGGLADPQGGGGEDLHHVAPRLVTAGLDHPLDETLQRLDAWQRQVAGGWWLLVGVAERAAPAMTTSATLRRVLTPAMPL